MPELDRIDRKILLELQRDATLPIAQIAERVGLSQTPCWKRIRKLEAAGIILRRIAVVDPAKVGLPLTVLSEVTALEHTDTWQQKFLAAVDAIPGVIEVLRLGGDADYLLRVVVPNVAAYDLIYRQIVSAVPVRAISSRFVMEVLRSDRALPLTEMQAERGLLSS